MRRILELRVNLSHFRPSYGFNYESKKTDHKASNGINITKRESIHMRKNAMI